MNATVDLNVEATKAKRTRANRKPAAQATREPGEKLSKSADPSLAKASFYLPVAVLDKLVVATRLRRQDMSEIVAEVLAADLSSIAFYVRPTKPAAESTPAATPPDTGEDRQDEATA